MKKIGIILGILCLNLCFGQVKAIKLTSQEVNEIANNIKSSSEFKDDIADKYNFKNTLGFLVEFYYEGKIIGKNFIPLNSYIFDEQTSYIIAHKRVAQCFETKNLSDSINFALLKTNNWNIKNQKNGVEYICTKMETSIDLFDTENNGIEPMNSVLNGAIKLEFYRIE